MAFNPSPKVADCREIAQKWGNQEQVIILAIDSEGRMQMATYGRTSELCSVAQALGNAAWKGIEDCIAAHERTLHAIADANTSVCGPSPQRAQGTQDSIVGGTIGDKP